MPKSTQIPEVGDTIMFCSHIDYLYGELLVLTDYDPFEADCFSAFNDREGYSTLFYPKEDKFYIVG